MRIEHVHHVETEIFLKPFDVPIGTMENLFRDSGEEGRGRARSYFDNRRIDENLIQNGQCITENQGIDEKVFGSGGNLHQTGEALVGSMGMMLGNEERSRRDGENIERSYLQVNG